MANAHEGLVPISGAAGFPCHHMVREAVEAGFRVRATDVSSRHCGEMLEALGVEFVAADPTRSEGIEPLLDAVTASSTRPASMTT